MDTFTRQVEIPGYARLLGVSLPNKSNTCASNSPAIEKP